MQLHYDNGKVVMWNVGDTIYIQPVGKPAGCVEITPTDGQLFLSTPRANLALGNWNGKAGFSVQPSVPDPGPNR